MLLAVGMLCAGTINTVASKWQDEIWAVAEDGTDPEKFNHPAVQTLSMFFGESLCMIAFLLVVFRARKTTPDINAEKKQKFPIWTFAVPAMCDMTATTLMYIGLLLTYPSVYQMLRGIIVVFTGIFSRIFLGRKLHMFHYFGMFLIIVGTFLVGLSSVMSLDSSTCGSDNTDHTDLPGRSYQFTFVNSTSLCQQTCCQDAKCKAWVYTDFAQNVTFPDHSNCTLGLPCCYLKSGVPKSQANENCTSGVKQTSSSASDPVLGDALVVAAQLVAATQMVVEEKFIGRYNVHPLQVVGNEGLWGVSVTFTLLFIGYWIPPMRAIDNSKDAILQIAHSGPLAVAIVLSVCSIAFFNFFGISVTKYLSATHRTTVDASRVFLVWLVSLLLKWEVFQWLQLVGFVVLLCGTSVFNEIFRLPYFYYPTDLEKNQAINEQKSLMRNQDNVTD